MPKCMPFVRVKTKQTRRGCCSFKQVHQADSENADECREPVMSTTEAPTWIHPIIMRLQRDAAGGLAEDGDVASALWDRFWRSL